MNGSRELHAKLTGSPSVAAVADVQTAMLLLMDAVAGRPIDWITEAWLVCDGCGARSEPLDTLHPDVAEEALLAAGWVRDAASLTDLCPTCVDGAR